mgnify:CR=1 FL=1
MGYRGDVGRGGWGRGGGGGLVWGEGWRGWRGKEEGEGRGMRWSEREKGEGGDRGMG